MRGVASGLLRHSPMLLYRAGEPGRTRASGLVRCHACRLTLVVSSADATREEETREALGLLVLSEGWQQYQMAWYCPACQRYT